MNSATVFVDREPVIATYEPLSLVNLGGLNLTGAYGHIAEKRISVGIARSIEAVPLMGK
jgi:hypothetical protein